MTAAAPPSLLRDLADRAKDHGWAAHVDLSDPAAIRLTLHRGGRRVEVCWEPGSAGGWAIAYAVTAHNLGPDVHVDAVGLPALIGGPS